MSVYIIAVVALVLRGLFTFAFLMRSGQALLERRKNETRFLAKLLWQVLSFVWVVAMAMSAAMDILLNVTLASVLYWDGASSWNETFSYRVGRYMYASNYTGTWRQQVSRPVCRTLKFLEGQDHCAYIYGVIPCPYPDLRTLLDWKVLA